jgi:peptidoglycan/LPS O-acetylase OafA/YrhL
MNWAYWSLGYELAFYILMGLLFLRRSALPIIVFSLFALLFSSVGYPFNHWGLFGLGAACHLFVERRWRSAAILAAICMCHVMIAHNLVETTVGFLTALLIAFPPPLISSPLFAPLKKVGLFSYSLYLTHVPMGCFLIPHYLGSRFTRGLWSSMLQDAILLSGCLIFACLFYRIVEKPTHELARRRSTTPDGVR